jgi:CRISPR system Cascade subunit CasB
MSETKRNPKRIAAVVLAYLRKLKDDRGAMAELRRALNPAQRHRAWPLLAGVDGIGEPRIEAVAGLFAYHPDETHDGNLGTTCRRLSGENNSFDARFRRLLVCDRDEICDRLRPVILAAKAKGIAVNYEKLLADLFFWGDRVQTDWARQYWGVVEQEIRDVTGTEAAP